MSVLRLRAYKGLLISRVSDQIGLLLLLSSRRRHRSRGTLNGDSMYYQLKLILLSDLHGVRDRVDIAQVRHFDFLVRSLLF